jgi:hypothetical protein
MSARDVLNAAGSCRNREPAMAFLTVVVVGVSGSKKQRVEKKALSLLQADDWVAIDA